MGRASTSARTFAAVGVSALVLAACGDQTSTVGSSERPQLWTVNTNLLQLKGGPLLACHSTLSSLPPAGCGGVELRGVDIDALPAATRYGNGTLSTAALRVVGTYSKQVLTVTEQPRQAPLPSPSPERPSPPVSCPDPAGGWPFDKVDQEGMSKVAEYTHTQPDGGTARVDRSQRIMTAPFTGDLDRHRAELAAIYDGPVCVEKTRASQRELRELEKKVTAQLKADGLGPLSAGTGNAFGTVMIAVVAATDQQRNAIAEQHDDLVEIESFLQPLPT